MSPEMTFEKRAPGLEVRKLCATTSLPGRRDTLGTTLTVVPGWLGSETVRSLTPSLSSYYRNKYGGIWRRLINFFKGSSLCFCDSIYGRVLLIVCSMNHIPPYLFLSREDDDDDVRDIGKYDLRSVLLHPMLSNANQARHEDSASNGMIRVK